MKKLYWFLNELGEHWVALAIIVLFCVAVSHGH